MCCTHIKCVCGDRRRLWPDAQQVWKVEGEKEGWAATRRLYNFPDQILAWTGEDQLAKIWNLNNNVETREIKIRYSFLYEFFIFFHIVMRMTS